MLAVWRLASENRGGQPLQFKFYSSEKRAHLGILPSEVWQA